MKMITLAKNGDNTPFANNGLKLSEKILIDKIEAHPKFQELFPIDDELLTRITNNIKEKGYDASQPVHIWVTKDENDTEHFYLIDGYTRIKAAKDAGLDIVPYFKHTFETYDEAYKYAIHMQLDRRQLNDADLLRNLRELMGNEYIQNYKGSKTQAIADELQVSTRSIQRAISVENNATDEQKKRIENGEASINQIYNENHPKRESNNEETNNDNTSNNKETNETQPTKTNDFTKKEATDEGATPSEDNESDSNDYDAQDDETTQEVQNECNNNANNSSNTNNLHDNHTLNTGKPRNNSNNNSYSNNDDDSDSENGFSEGTPAGLNFNHSDGIERPVKPRDDSDPTDIIIRDKNLQIENAKKEYYAKGFKDALKYAISNFLNGRTSLEITQDERVKDLSTEGLEHFELTAEEEDAVKDLII